MSTTVSTPLLEINHHQSDANGKGSLKRPRPKTVTWATAEQMHQVCLFAVEDAPASLAMISQDLLQAKKVKMLHMSSAIDVHPGYGGAVTNKRARLDVAMDTQLSWKCPEKFLYKPSWLVAAGDNSLERPAQQHREVRVLEAFYPRISAIPASPIEPPYSQNQVDNSEPRQIPLTSCEDEEDAIPGAGPRSTSNDPIPSGISTSKLAPQINSDPDVAAAAAAAFAVLKAQEKGSLIDHDLLIKILSNPLLTETLKQSNVNISSIPNPNQVSSNGRVAENGKGSSPYTTQGRGIHCPSDEKGVLPWQQGNPMWQPWGFNVGMNAGLSHGRGLHAPVSFDQEKGILGNGKGAFGINTFPEHLCQDGLKKLFPHAHFRCMPTNELLRPCPSFHEVKARNMGQACQPLLESSVNAPFPRKSAMLSERIGGTKIRRPCLFFNTPKGCRNGVHCNFSHEPSQVKASSVDKSKLPDVAEETKTPKGDDVETKAS